jgi:ELWxxDGT repeat protein
MLAIGSTAYFAAGDGTHGAELWKSDGTAAGTVMVKDIFPGGYTYRGRYYPNSSSPDDLTNVNGTLFFVTNYDGGLWKSDGTDAGTMRVTDIGARYLTDVNGTLFFSSNYGDHGFELWKSDGTAAGTVMVKDIFPGSYTGYYGGYYPNNSYPKQLTNVNGTLFFTAWDGTTEGLWKSDGTEAGTVQVSSVYGTQLTNVNGTLFFASGELWKSDGTAAGTTLVKDIAPDALANVNGTLFFRANDGIHGDELWKSDGTAAGTTLVKDIFPGAPYNSSEPYALTNVNGTLYFSAGDGINGRELWRSDGTAAGTTLVKDINPGSATSYPLSLTNVNGTLYFRAGDGIHVLELWKSNGTTAGTVMLGEINAAGPVFPGSRLANANGTLFFAGNDGVHGTELWALSTTTAPAPSLGVSGFPATTTAGSAGSVTITAKNANGTTNTGYRGTVHFTSSDPQANVPADYTFTAADNGVHTFTAKLKTAGYQSITATDTQAPGMDGESIILVNAAAASTMTVGGFPFTTTAGVAGNVTVTLKDIYGNIASGYTGTVRLTSSDPQAALPANYTFTAADAGGTHTFSVTLKTAGTRSITAADTVNSALTATQGGITVKAGAASKLLISAPSSVTVGVRFSLTLTVQDAYGNVVTDYTGTVRFTSTDSTAKLPANYTFRAADKGVHTFTGLVLRKKGIWNITITDMLNSSLTASVVENVN